MTWDHWQWSLRLIQIRTLLLHPGPPLSSPSRCLRARHLVLRTKFSSSWMMQTSGQRTVPQIYINERSIGGFSELSALEKSGQLDALLAG